MEEDNVVSPEFKLDSDSLTRLKGALKFLKDNYQMELTQGASSERVVEIIASTISTLDLNAIEALHLAFAIGSMGKRLN